MRQLNVFPECYVDTNLVSYLLGSNVKHKSSCNEVVKALNKSETFAVGIIDADKRMPTFDAGFIKHIRNNATVDDYNKHLTMYIHNDGKRFLFTVKPAMDTFIMDAAEECGIKLVNYGFPSTLAEFKKITKTVQAAGDPKLRRLFMGINGAAELQRFRNTLKYLTSKEYDTDVSIVKKFFDGELSSSELVNYL